MVGHLVSHFLYCIHRSCTIVKLCIVVIQAVAPQLEWTTAWGARKGARTCPDTCHTEAAAIAFPPANCSTGCHWRHRRSGWLESDLWIRGPTSGPASRGGLGLPGRADGGSRARGAGRGHRSVPRPGAGFGAGSGVTSGAAVGNDASDRTGSGNQVRCQARASRGAGRWAASVSGAGAGAGRGRPGSGTIGSRTRGPGLGGPELGYGHWCPNCRMRSGFRDRGPLRALSGAPVGSPGRALGPGTRSFRT